MTPRPLLCLLLACAPERLYDEPQGLLPPVATRDALVWADRAADELVLVRPDGDDLEVRRVELGDDRTQIAWIAATLGRDAALALTVPASAKEEDAGEQLHRVPADGDGDPVVYDVQAPFSAVALSPDHRRAVLFFGSEGSSEQLHNANQVAIVDLRGDGVENVTLNGFGGALLRVEFPGQLVAGEPAPITIGGAPRDVAAFLAAGEIVLMDLDAPAADQVAVPLGPDVGFTPGRTLLRPGNPQFPDPALFVLPGGGGPEVGMLTLLGEADGSGFTAQISLISAGGRATDFVFHDAGEVPYLITVDDAADALVFTDIRTQGGFAVPLGAPAVYLFLRDGEDGRQVVAWSPGGAALSTLDLDGIGDSLGRKPRQLKIETGVESLVRLDDDRVLVGSGTRLYVVDFPGEQVTPLSSRTPYDPRGSALVGDRLLLGTAGQSWVSTVDLRTLGPESMLLDATISTFHYLPGPDRIVVTHPDAAGHLTVVDAADPSRATSRVQWGFLLQGALDRK
jgi:hypothetical protein